VIVSKASARFVLAAALLLAPAAAFAQKPGKHKPAAHTATNRKTSSAPAPSSSGSKERAPSTASSESATASSDDSGGGDDSSASGEAAAPATAPPAGKVKSKTYTFGAMDVEGKLKTPQLLYFLNRVKMELDMSAPDKRSFMKELQQSADDKNL
jgi:hypothetical protein